MSKNSLKNLIEELKEGGVDTIKNLLSNKEVEQFCVDFKTTQWEDYTDKKSLAPNDRKNIEKAISGFGNSEGGLLVWGVGTESEGDFADLLKPIISPETFLSLINKAISRFTIPRHTSVEGFVIKEKENKGFVVMVVPKFEGLPIQVVNSKLFYMRAGDSFAPLPHSILSGMFGRRPNPEIILQFIFSPESLDEEKCINCSIGLFLRNKGKGMAKDVFVNSLIHSSGGENCQIGWQMNDNKFSGYDMFRRGSNLMSNNSFRLAYGQGVQPIVYTFKFKPPFSEDLKLDFTVGAEGQAPNQLEIRTKKEDLAKAYDLFVANKTDFVCNIFKSKNYTIT